MEPRFNPKDIRTPIQLTSVWFLTLVGLVIALLKASHDAPDQGMRVFFGASAVAVIAPFVVAVFRLQTKYRQELLADEYYSRIEKQVRQVAADRGVELSTTQPERIAKRAARNYRVLAGASILWVDDDPASVRSEQQLLRDLGVDRIDSVTSADDAEERVHGHRPDVIISDMARGDDERAGEDLLRRLGRDAPPVIIYLTEYKPELGVPEGAFGITNRPDELANLVLDALERIRA